MVLECYNGAVGGPKDVFVTCDRDGGWLKKKEALRLELERSITTDGVAEKRRTTIGASKR